MNQGLPRVGEHVTCQKVGGLSGYKYDGKRGRVTSIDRNPTGYHEIGVTLGGKIVGFYPWEIGFGEKPKTKVRPKRITRSEVIEHATRTLEHIPLTAIQSAQYKLQQQRIRQQAQRKIVHEQQQQLTSTEDVERAVSEVQQAPEVVKYLSQPTPPPPPIEPRSVDENRLAYNRFVEQLPKSSKTERVTDQTKPMSEQQRQRIQENTRRRNSAIDSGLFEALLKRQNYACALPSCGVKFADVGMPHLDHDPRTGAIRGLLCPPHNTALNHLTDNVAVLKNFIEYIEHPPAEGLEY